MRGDTVWGTARRHLAPVLGPDAPALRRHAVFALLFATSVIAGRLTASPDTGVAMVWPASGVAFVWFLTAMRREDTAWGHGATIATAAIIGITSPLNALSGMSPALAVVFGVGNAAAGFFAAWCYRAGRAGRRVTLERLTDLPLLLAASLAAGLGSAIWGPLYTVVVGGGDAAILWQAVTRTGIGTLIFGAAILRILSRPPTVALPRRSVVAALLMLTTVAYWVTMMPLAHQPLSFVLTCITVIAALVLTVDGLLAFILAAGAVIVGASFLGLGPFALAASNAEIFVAQAYVGAQAVIGMVLAFGRDDKEELIAALHSSRTEAENQSEMLRRVLASMTESVLSVEKGEVALLNDSARAMFGLEVGAPVRGTVLSTGDAADGRALDAALAGRPAMEDLVLEGRGQKRVVSVWAQPVGVGLGHAVIVVRDVTEHRRQLADLSSFASVLAHDLLNPIGAVEGWLEVISEESDEHTPATITTGAERAASSARRLREIVTGLHAYSVARGGELSMVEIDLQALAARLVAGRVETARRAGDAPVPDCEVDARRRVLGDEALVAQVLDNLIGNAAKYAEPGSIPRIRITADAPVDGFVTVRVDDEGIGIPAADRDKVFEEFHRVGAHSKAYAGTGLGLSICRRMIERHGGRIRALEAPGGGTRMEFTLPSACSRTTVEATGEEVRAAGLQGRTAHDAAHDARRRLERRLDGTATVREERAGSDR